MAKKTVLTLICDGCTSPVFISEFQESLLPWTKQINCPTCGHEHRDQGEIYKLRMYSKLTRSYQ